MEAITRKEKIMSGENLTPITRKEMFLAKAAGMDVETPEPITREEIFLSKIKGGSGGGSGGGEEWIGDGKTHLWIKIAAEGRMDVPLYFQQTVANGVTIDWGDGSAMETLSGVGKVNTTHTYATIGEYIITLDVADGCTLGFGYSSSGQAVMGYVGNNNNKVYTNMLKKVEVGNGVISIANYAFVCCFSLASILIPEGVTSIGDSAFASCYSLANILIPESVTSIGKSAFQHCSSLASILIPEGVTSIENQALQNCRTLASILIPEGVTSIGGYAVANCEALVSAIISGTVTSIGDSAFASCYSLANILIPESVTSIGSTAFYNCVSMKFFDFTKHTAVPVLSNTDAFKGIPYDCEIRVPAALVDEWKAATNWSTYASNIVAV